MKKEEKLRFSFFFPPPPLTPVISMESHSEHSEWDDEKSRSIHTIDPFIQDISIRRSKKQLGKRILKAQHTIGLGFSPCITGNVGFFKSKIIEFACKTSP